ncbi:MAG: hypothetical protein ACLR07_11025 [Christensenellales bacterium]
METIEAFADETVFRNDENGYTVLVIKAGRSRVSAVGIMPPISIGKNCASPANGRSTRFTAARSKCKALKSKNRLRFPELKNISPAA